jgi:hypothetical protein
VNFGYGFAEMNGSLIFQLLEKILAPRRALRGPWEAKNYTVGIVFRIGGIA